MALEQWLPSLLAALVAAGGTYVVFRRKFSGRIDVSEAKELWDESSKFRQDLRAQVENLEREILRLRRDNHQLRNHMLKMQLAAAPNVPDDIKQALVEESERHIQELQDALERKAGG